MRTLWHTPSMIENGAPSDEAVAEWPAADADRYIGQGHKRGAVVLTM